MKHAISYFIHKKKKIKKNVITSGKAGLGVVSESSAFSKDDKLLLMENNTTVAAVMSCIHILHARYNCTSQKRII